MNGFYVPANLLQFSNLKNQITLNLRKEKLTFLNREFIAPLIIENICKRYKN